jgi:uncharacterized membrane protein YgcG
MLGLGAATPAIADRGAYSIEQFDVDLTVEAGSDLLVEERLDVVFTEPRHGIYRTIPVRYSDARGFSYSLGFRLLEVTDHNGAEVPAKVTDEGRYKKIRIGHADREVTGRVSYLIRYRIRDALGHFAEHDELYWNATGHEWNTSIGASSATVHLPGSPPPDTLEASGYTGTFGSRAQSVDVSHPSPGVVRFASSAPFDPLEGLTVVVAWPHGFVDFPGPIERAGIFLADNWVVLFPLFWFGFLWRRYQKEGKDPGDDAPVMVQYEPPEGLTPGEVGAMVDETIDLRDITATVVDLAVRGFLEIRTEPKEMLFGMVKIDDTVFERVPGAATDGLRKHERLVLSGLFAPGDVVGLADLRNRFYKSLPGIKNAVWDRLVRKGYFAEKPAKVISSYVGLGFLAGIGTGAFSLGWLWLRGGAPPGVFFLPIGLGVVTLFLFLGFSPAMPRKTKRGVRARKWAEGFEEYVDRVEGDRFERQDPRQLFEKLLPYAMALNVAGEWAQRFEGIYDNDPPRWYGSHRHSTHGFSTASFEQSLSSTMSAAGQGMASSPRSSSGSGGGGSSGGGGGGGGGGSW